MAYIIRNKTDNSVTLSYRNADSVTLTEEGLTAPKICKFVSSLSHEAVEVDSFPDDYMDGDIFKYDDNGWAVLDQATFDAHAARVAELEAEKAAEQLAILSARVREDRNALLAETDWWAVSDRTMTQEEIDYRQLLRDIPDQSDFPNTVNWPVKP